MQLKHIRSILPPQDGAAKIAAIAWSPNNLKLAICSADRVIILFDESGERKDKFSTKPADPKYGKRSYTVRGLAFSPDSTKIAVGQTDNIIFVYKIGEEWGEKKIICNKFVQQSAVTCLVWPTEGSLVFGLADGKVRTAHSKTNKSQTLYATDSYVVSLAVNSHGTGILSGHADGTIVRFYVADDPSPEPQGRVAKHPVPPYALAWPLGCVIVAGCDKKVLIYSTSGQVSQQFDYSRDHTEKEFTTACCSPSGQAVAIGSYDRIRIYSWNQRKASWDENPAKEIQYLYSITALGWKRDGSRVVCGTLCGAAELFESVLKRTIYKNKFELTYVGPSQVLVKPLAAGVRGVILKSQFGYEIEDVRIMGQENYLVARTTETLLLGDLQRNLLSEIPWNNTGHNEKFYFENPTVCMIFNAGELTLVEYGKNCILGSARTEFMNPHQISVRVNERKQHGVEDNKKLAYLLDLKTICIVDLAVGVALSQVNHESKIDWLELNETGAKLLFRDKKSRLTLFDVKNDHGTSILNYCTFVQWIPGSDVVVAQSRNTLCVWYNIDTPERVTMNQIKGDVVDVVKEDGKTEVVVQEGHRQIGIELNDGLIQFGTAIDDGDFVRAITYLESIGNTPEAEAMWRTLANMSLEFKQLRVAERCFGALGDIAKTHYLKETIEVAEDFAINYGGNGMDCPEVYARLAILDKQLKTAEAIYLDQNQLDKALQMYQKLHKWDEALILAQAKGHPDVELLKENYMKWLTETKQEEKAGELKEKEGDHLAALNLYLKAGLPTRASRLIQSTPHMLDNQDLVAKVASALLKGEFYEQAGELYEKVNSTDQALECYKKGQAYNRAVELARISFPTEVVVLEEEWGDELASNKQLDAAINHYIEAGKTIKALEAAMNARQWKKAVQIIQVIEDASSVSAYYQKLGQHFASVQDYQMAERFFIEGGMHKEAIDMYNQAGQWEKAHRLASQHLRAEEVSEMYVNQAQTLEDQGKFREAEKLYISVSEPDLAITMYKKNRQYDQMMRLVSQYHPDLVQTTHLHLAQELEAEGNWRGAEQHYLQAGDWKGAVNMYRAADMWEDAYRVAKSSGGPQAGRQVAFLWAKSLGGDSAVKLLTKFGLLEACIDYACESYQFEFAFDLARTAMKHKMSDIHYKYAMALEDDGKFAEAEKEFIKAEKPKEAVLMYVHNQDWDGAQRVAENHDPDSVADVLIGQAKVAFEERNYARFEALLLRAEKPELIVKQYQDIGMWVEALKVCREYLPHKLPALQAEYDREVGSKGSRDAEGLIAQAREWEDNREYKCAIDCYMKINTSNTTDHNILRKAWQKAADLTVRFLDGDQSVEVTKILAPRLLDIEEYVAAAQLYVGVDMIKEAIDAFIEAGEWGKAKKVAKELEPSFEPYVDNAYKESLRKQGRVDQLADVDIIGALDMFVEQGQWSKCLDTAQQHGPQVLHKYVALYASQLIKEGHPLEALRLYTKYGAPTYSQNYNIYKRIVMDVFNMKGLSNADAYKSWAQLRNMLFDLTENMKKSSDAGSSIHDEFDLLLLICHYYATRCACKGTKSLEKIAAKISVSLLRHTDIIPADKGFYDAGIDTREVGWESMAFVFLNRYLDICEAIEEGNLELLDNTDFAGTDIPFEVPLPSTPYLDPSEHEEVKEWVLTVSMDQKVEQVLPVDERMVYEASLKTPDDRTSLPCVISGYPVLKNKVEFKRPGKAASKEDWNKVMMATKMSPESDLHDVLNFISNWCGGMPNFSFQ